MKKGWKIFAIVCGSAVGVGVLMCIASLMLGVTWHSISEELADGVLFVTKVEQPTEALDDWDDEWEESSHWEKAPVLSGDFEEIFYHVDSLSIDLAAGTMNIVRYDGGEVKLSGKAVNKNLRTRCAVEGTTLEFKTSGKVWKEQGLEGKEAGTYTLYIPEGMALEEIEIVAGAGDLKVDGLNGSEMSLEIGAGNAVLTNLYIGETDVVCGAGNVELSGTLEGDIDIECGVGNVTMQLQAEKTDYNYDIANGIGNLSISGENYTTLTGTVYEDYGAPYTIEVSGGLGNIEIGFQ